MRSGLALLLRGKPDVEIVGEASDAGEPLRLVHNVLPDVVLMDIDMPGISGVEAAKIVSKECLCPR